MQLPSTTARGPRIRTILSLAVPIVGGMVSQNLLNLVDLAMVGTLGGPALAAVGLAGMATVMAVSLISGIVSGGVQPAVARRKGGGRDDETAVPLNGGLLLAFALGVPVAAAIYVWTPDVFPFLNHDPAVVAHGVPYTRARLVSTAAVAANFAYRGFWNGINRPRVYLHTLVLMHATNIVLDWILIFGKLGAPALGTLGAGIASSAAVALGTVYYTLMGWRHARPNGFLARRPSRETLRSLVRLGLPVGLQQLLFFVGFTTLLWIVGRVGTLELAVANVVVNLTLVAILPGLGLGLAAASLVGQALGRGDPTDARRWGWEVAGVCMVAMLILGAPLLAIPDILLAAFLRDTQALTVGRFPLQLVGATLFLDGLGLVLLNALVGAGDGRRVMLVAASLQWGLALPAAWVAGPVLGLGLAGIWSTVVAWRCLQAALLAGLWQGHAWTTRRV